MDIKFKNKVVLITGSSRGIGAAIAKKFANDGAIIIIHHMKDNENAEKLVKRLLKYNKKTVHYQSDVRNEEEVQSMKEYIQKKFGRLDILINNAGISSDHTLKKMNIKSDWNDVLNTNLTGVMYCTKILSPLIPNNKGKIVNISSIIAVLGNFGQCGYSASKAGLVGFTLSLAKEYAEEGINVNAVLPGFIETNMIKNIPIKIKKKILNNIPLKRFGKSEEVANLVYFLCSKEADYITGQSYIIDGGLTINSI